VILYADNPAAICYLEIWRRALSEGLGGPMQWREFITLLGRTGWPLMGAHAHCAACLLILRSISKASFERTEPLIEKLPLFGERQGNPNMNLGTLLSQQNSPPPSVLLPASVHVRPMAGAVLIPRPRARRRSG
jgi:hypothetical protein